MGREQGASCIPPNLHATVSVPAHVCKIYLAGRHIRTSRFWEIVGRSLYPRRAPRQQRVAAVNAFQQKQQDALKDVYDALSVKGGLRGFGSVSSPALLPLSVKELSTDDQLRLTGLPVTAFAPPQGNSPADLLAGGFMSASHRLPLGVFSRRICSAVGADDRVAVPGGGRLHRVFSRNLGYGG